MSITFIHGFLFRHTVYFLGFLNSVDFPWWFDRKICREFSQFFSDCSGPNLQISLEVKCKDGCCLFYLSISSVLSCNFFVKSQRVHTYVVLDCCHLTIFDITILSAVLQRKRKQHLIQPADFMGSLHWIIKSQKFTVCTGSDFWPNRIQFSIVHDVTVLCTLTQGKIAVKSLSYLKRFRRRFSGELQPKAHSLTRFAAWEISSISQKTRYFAARLDFFFFRQS